MYPYEYEDVEIKLENPLEDRLGGRIYDPIEKKPAAVKQRVDAE